MKLIKVAVTCPNCEFETPVDPDFTDQKCRVCGEVFYDDAPPEAREADPIAAGEAAQHQEVARLMRKAISADRRRIRAITQIESILAGPTAPEQLRCRAETVITEWVENISHDVDDCGFSLSDAKEMIEEI